MRALKPPSFVRATVASGLLICSFLLSATRADVVESARLLPDDTAIMISVESVKEVRAAWEKTSFYSLCKDPAVQQAIGQADKKIRELIDTTIKDFWHKAQIENPPEQIPYPEGRLIFGVSFVGEPAPAGTETPKPARRPRVQMQLVLLADMGSQAAQARQVVRALSTNVVSPSGTLQRKELAGIELDVRMPPEGKREPMISYGFKDNWLLVTLDETCRTDFTEAVARRLGRTLPESLADKPGFRAAARTLGEAHVFAFVNPDALKTLLATRVKDQASLERLIKGLGLANVTCLASAIRIAGDRSQDMCVKGLVGVQGSRTGLPALLGPASGPLKVSDRLVARDAVGFLCANYEPAKLFDDLSKIVQEAAYQDLNMIVQAGLAATAGDGGQPPAQLRDDILAQIGAPLLVTWKTDRPYTEDSNQRFLFALPVRDGSRLDAALGRVHKAFLGADPKSRRELLGHVLYLLPMPGPTAGERTQMAFSVAGDHFVFGPVDDVEQAIRSLQKEPDNILASDPMFRYARERLPSQAGLYYYQNDRLNMEAAWVMIKQMIREFTAPAQGESEQESDLPEPVTKTLKTLLQYVDISQLPDFKAVEKYWGATVGFLQSRPEGLYWESTSLKPAQP